jgi:hypothetical protein
MNDKIKLVDAEPKPPPRGSPPRKDFFWIEMNQFADLRDIAEFTKLADEHFKRRHEKQIARVPEKVRNVEELFAPPHEMHVHWAVIILLVIRLEETVKAVSAVLHKNDALPKAIGDFKKGSLIERFRDFLVKSAGWTTNVPKSSTWNDAFGVYAIRNCLIHYQASFGDYAAANKNRASEIRRFSNRYGTPGIIDTWLDIDLQTSLLCVEKIQQFFDELFGKLKKRPDYLVTKT